MVNKLISKFRFQLNRFKTLKRLAYLPGHFSSPVVMPEEIKDRIDTIFKIKKELLPGIDINETEQFNLLTKIGKYYSDLSFPAEKKNGYRYYYNNTYFSYNSAIELFGIIRHFEPKRIVEVGSGFSSALILDTNDLFMNNSITCTFVDPYPNRLLSLLNDNDRSQHTILPNKVQEIDLNCFFELQENDILFIDSSHVSKTGSDLNFMLFKVLPYLKKGVIVHFHDVFYPFEYPKEWVMTPSGFGWNECYLLRAFLMYNTSYEILFFNSYLEYFFTDWFKQHMPDCLKQQGGSLYIKKNN